jgi:hypothetical protein
MALFFLLRVIVGILLDLGIERLQSIPFLRGETIRQHARLGFQFGHTRPQLLILRLLPLVGTVGESSPPVCCSAGGNHRVPLALTEGSAMAHTVKQAHSAPARAAQQIRH